MELFNLGHNCCILVLKKQEMKKYNFCIMLALSLVVVACGNKKEVVTNDNSTIVEEMKSEENQSKQPSQATARLVDMSKDVKTDPFTILDVHIHGNIMHLTVQYGGGCQDHKFEVLGSKMIMKSMPPQRPVIITHDAGGDMCRALITEELHIDISDLAYQQEEGSEIILILEGRDKISYVYAEAERKKEDK